MTVEIIEKGRGKETVCEHCKSRLAYYPDDIVPIYRGANWGGETPDRYDGLVCPACGQKTVIEP